MLNFGNHEYVLDTQWSVQGNIHNAYEVLGQPLDYPKWLGLKHFTAREIVPPAVNGLGQTVEFKMKGWLPYQLCWQLKSVETEKPRSITGVSTGDFEGLGVWTLKQREEWVDITFTWKVTVQHPFLRRWGAWLRPLFSWNHHWVMGQAKQGMTKRMSGLYV